VLHHHRQASHGVTVADISNFERDEVAASKLAIDAEVEQRELAHAVFHL